MDTVGSLIDKLATVNQKMFINQEFLYELREMNFADFVDTYGTNLSGMETLFNNLKKVVDLNLQRQNLILEIDKLLVQMAQDITTDPSTKYKYIQDQHKTHQLKEGNE